jgi:TolA-binding protein
MARRRRLASSSSLDLFLDTICNAFGGIMFISILIAVMAQMQGNATPQTEQPTISQSQAEEFSQQIENRQSELDSLKQVVALLEKQVPSPDQNESVKLQERVVEARKHLDEVVQRQTQEAKKLSDTQSAIAKLKQDAEETERKLMEAKAAMQKKNIAVADALDSSTSKIPLPSVNASQKGNVLLAMRYGKVYFVSDPSADSGSDLYSDHVSSSKSGGEVRVALKKDKGFDFKIPAEMDAFRAGIAGVPSTSKFLSIAVWPDSFGDFKKLRAIIVPLQFEYQLLPLEDVADLPVRKGSAPTIQ